MSVDACPRCLRRTELIAWLSGHIEQEWRLRRGRPQLLALPDDELLRWAGLPEVAARYRDFRSAFATDRLLAAGMGAACGCSAAYPPGLRDLPDPPAVLHWLGDARLLGTAGVGIVGARRASAYGLEVARGLGRGLAATGLTVVSGMAMGVDSAAHAGALEAGVTIAVLATGADRPYPANGFGLHRRILAAGCVVSELPPGTEPRRWAFPARNRIIAALSRGTVVVEGGERSGSLITADFASELGRFVGAVPGHVTANGSAGPHALLKVGAEVIRSTEDVLDLVHGAGAVTMPLIVGAGPRPAPSAAAAAPDDLPAELAALLARVEAGAGSLAELTDDPPRGCASPPASGSSSRAASSAACSAGATSGHMA